MRSKRILYLSLVLMLVVLSSSFSCAAKTLELSMGSSSTTSSYYANTLTWAKVINENVPKVHITVVESGGSLDNLARTRTGEFQLSCPTSYSALLQSYLGVGSFEGKPDKSLRILGISNPGAVYTLVREDSGITDIKGLDGKKFYAGPPGHLTTTTTTIILEEIGVNPDYFIGGFRDAVTATQDNRIVGFVKFGAGMQVDASMIEVSALTPCRLLSWTPEMIDMAIKIAPGAVSMTMPKGSIEAFPEEGAVATWGQLITFWTTKDLPEDAAYDIIKAIIEHWESDIAPNFAPCRDVDPLNDTIKYISAPETAVPFHIGALKYYEKMGMKVPAKLIPPEK